MSGVQSTAGDVDVDLRQLFASLARNWLRLVLFAVAVTALAFVLASLATPKYRAETRLLIETRESVFTRPDGSGENERPILDEEGVTSQVEVIGSTDILKQVAKKLDLASLPEFDAASEMSAISRLLVIAGLKSDPGELPPEERVLKAFREKLTVYRVEKSRVIVIQFSSADPKLAAAVPNAIAQAYLDFQRGSKLESSTEATDWLKPEIADLNKRVKDAEAKVASFRSQSDLLVGQNNSALATQQLSELSSELSRVRASRSAAEATAQSVRQALKGGGSIDAIPEVLSSGLIQRLRERQIQLRTDIADLSTTLLPNHPRIKALNSQLADLDTQIRSEAEKVLVGLVNEANGADLREKQLVADLNRLKVESGRVSEEEVELRALEREAAAQRALLESYLTRYREAASRQDRNYLPVDARVFSTAIVPSEAYFPKIVPIVGAAFVGSLLLMAIFTLLQELFSGRAMRPAAGARVTPVTQVEMPVRRVAGLPQDDAAQAWAEAEEPAVAVQLDTADADGEPRTLVDAQHDLAVAADEQPFETALAPAHGGISIETAAEKLITSGAARAIFVSPEGDDAAATAVLVAREVADSGLRVLLLDLTASGAAAGPMLDGGRYPGITNLLASEAQFTDVIRADHYSDCDVMPVGTADPARAMRAADRLPIIMESLTTAYDLVVVECGPADAGEIARLVGDGTEVLVSFLHHDDEIAYVADDLRAGGYEDVMLVTPVGHDLPTRPEPTRSAA
ncbi:exopolysaccharide transport family protein [Aminobacter aminovorans]|uniref:Cryptic autophosphorylating protein tyrosine kinase Etk n=1 Tax=Aminobacter aminovorans TaxID=83263 RepID=A0A380WNT8_AMIAI|nr:exopolysaccharide transport family protein [Aminobacter aminovorans]TCS25880.1 exopolysaccharide transport family protein [Aminobacter aminovorans]SUU90455.1 cryptic autophosphorylating protein tyrosine kinase Etk [Aminobacter aminovorans]